MFRSKGLDVIARQRWPLPNEIEKAELLDEFLFEPVPDSFVVDENKVGTGHGEKALHVGSKNDEKVVSFFGPHGSSIPVKIYRSDLLRFMQEVRPDYYFPSKTYRRADVLTRLWQERHSHIQGGPPSYEMTLQPTTKTGERYYLTSSGEAWELLHQCPLPKIARLIARRVQLEGEEFMILQLSPFQTIAQEMSWPAEDLSEALDRLQSDTPQLVLAGPPGTGKSWAAKRIARLLTGGDEERISFVQFHPSYSYEDFVYGLRPVASKRGVTFKAEPGVLINFANKARANDGRFVLVIDEINRANLPRVLGELMYLLEYRSEEIRLQHGPMFSLPKNLSLIGTMNTADRSIRTIDAALRRRFDFFDCQPNPEALAYHYEQDERQCTVENLAEGLGKLNNKLAGLIDRHHTIGHSFFMKTSFNYVDLTKVWKRQIFPLIEEYLFDEPDLEKQFTLHEFWPATSE